MMDQKNLKDIGFSVSKTMFSGVISTQEYNILPERVTGILANWVTKKDYKMKIEYPLEMREDGVVPSDIFTLNVLLAHDFRFEVGARGKAIPKRSGCNAARTAPADAFDAAAEPENASEAESNWRHSVGALSATIAPR